MKSPTPEAQCAEGVFQIQSPICGINISNNVSVTQVRVNERNTNLTQPLKSLNHQLPPLDDPIISPHVKHPPINFPKNVCSPMQSIFMKKDSPYFARGEETLCFILVPFPIPKIFLSQYRFEIFQTLLNLNCKIIQLKTLNLVINLSIISNKASNLFSAIFSEINTVSNTNLILQ